MYSNLPWWLWSSLNNPVSIPPTSESCFPPDFLVRRIGSWDMDVKNMVAGTKILSESSLGQIACMGRGCVPLLIHFSVYIVSGFLPPPGGPYSDLQGLQQLECFWWWKLWVTFIETSKHSRISPWQTQVLNIQHYRTLALIMKSVCLPLKHVSQTPPNSHEHSSSLSLFPSSSSVFTVSLQKLLILLLCFETFFFIFPSSVPFFLIYPQKEWPQIYIYWNWNAHSCWKGTCALILHDANLHLGMDFCLFDGLSQGWTCFLQTFICGWQWGGGWVFSLVKSDEESPH